jgi:hypothetical protein
MRMKGIHSLRELSRLLDTDPRFRRLCFIKKKEKGYPGSVLSRFISRIGMDNLTKIIEEKIVKLLQHGTVDVDAVLDDSFMKAWSIRRPTDNQIGFSDAQARVCRSGATSIPKPSSGSYLLRRCPTPRLLARYLALQILVRKPAR